MRNHAHPTPDQIKDLRLCVHLSQTEFAAVVHSSLRSVQHWESGVVRMPACKWELASHKLAARRAVALAALAERDGDQ